MFVTVESCFTITLGGLSFVLCGQKYLDATVRGGDWNSEAEGSTPKLQKILEFLTPGNINIWKPTQTYRGQALHKISKLQYKTPHANPVAKHEHMF